ncbi:MAG: class I SAM-dependent methyltransferase [Pseudomonadota bacterium]
MNYDDAPFAVQRYREMQKALPGADALYQLCRAQLETYLPLAAKVLVVGAGGGREIENLGASESNYAITGVDPSEQMLEIARYYASICQQRARIELVTGTVADLPLTDTRFDAATSLLVMHFLQDDDGADGKRAYCDAIRERLKPGAVLLHADVSFDNAEDFQTIVPVFRRYGALAGLAEEEVEAGPGIIQAMPIISSHRTAALLQAAGFGAPQLFFQSLWYRAWMTKAI